ncbi:LLM class flavin-dependent oxidoreductase [Arthrobacter pascens]|uniref:LLM class flavin-dependent oxidoreductase n=1 Tax=Arthrobacter pascens TaxID=1677 RepID=UPI00196A9D17|nr:LLM class flavin-dependent oxidoreductase [Arthrobacter pascens]MBN3499705.1 LLM class flavin-dependent oxidoreductase [Arthrobacter pascens]
MSKNREPMIMTAAVMYGLGGLHDAWKVRAGEASDYMSPDYYANLARTAEAGKLHALFLAEQITNADSGTDRPSGTLDTATVLSYMAAVTDRIGLVGTASTTYNEPFEIARRFGTLDHLSRGRAGWNSVTTAHAGTALQFGDTELPDAEARYSRADEFMDIVIKLWDSWEEGALVGDKVNGIFADPAKVHDINHAGAHFSVKGPLPFARTPQGRPVIFQAGSSERGRDQAARVADVVFTAQHTTEGAREFRADIRRRAEAYGRSPNSIKVLPGMSVILGATEQEAWDRKKILHETVPMSKHLSGLSRWTGLPVDALELDKPLRVDLLSSDEDFKGGVGWRRSIVNLALKDNLTVRELIEKAPTAHFQVVGTAAQVADAMEERLDAGAADGFTLMVPILPEGLDAVVEMLVPELQERGLFHHEYEHDTLRGSLGLQLPDLVTV